MKTRDLIEMIFLASLWGGSFICMRIAAPEFGPVPLIFMRVTLAALGLLPLLALRGGLGDVRRYWFRLLVLGVINSAIPFSLLAYTTLFLPAGPASILNATSPLFGTVVAVFWIKERLTAARVIGLIVGFSGVVFLVWGKTPFAPGSVYAVPAALTATLCYGVAATFAKKAFRGISPLAMATGSMGGASVAMLAPGLYLWPAQMPSGTAWLGLVILALACTSLAYILYYRLIANVGPSKAIAVTYLIPVFGMVWGVWLLSEVVTARMVTGCSIILLGTALATGVIAHRSPAALKQA